MRSVLALALLASVAGAGCHDDVEMFPIGPGGFGPGGGTTPDAAIVDGNGEEATTINGRVCLINDPRKPTECAGSGADGLTVTLGTETATTAADGSFTIMTEGGTGLVWRVTGQDVIYASAMQVSTVHLIPAIGLQLYEDMVTTNQAVAGDGSGAIIARLTSGGAGVSGLQAATEPASPGLVYYDGASAANFDTTATASFGVIWAPGLTPGSVTLTLSGSQDKTLAGIPVYADTVTFVLAAI
jgi:hypothetical protein